MEPIHKIILVAINFGHLLGQTDVIAHVLVDIHIRTLLNRLRAFTYIENCTAKATNLVLILFELFTPPAN